MSLESIKLLVDELTTLHVTRGVQPSELVDNIFEDDYVESASRKTQSGIVFEITFLETDDDGCASKVTMRYTYDQRRYLVLVEQKVAAKKFSVQWDRAVAIQDRVTKLEASLYEKLPQDQVQEMLSSMPEDFAQQFPRLKLAA
ncbi:hypothetical protein [Pseudomonas koreensis]|jgi:hypothetical protein|uniref:Uncharacterized protein n=1 Tax=Pseudomonas koreensis TaxID=198620 RepID=A0AA94EPR5_9PSED|nr:hypothetical protein [Pseudomonas koreensis]RVD77569.1 hypothetical protein A9HBioS_2569 [Pseudomonas koreensis]